jgi:hypothetical protein
VESYDFTYLIWVWNLVSRPNWKRKLRAIEGRVLRSLGLFGHKIKKMVRGWGKLHNEYHNVYFAKYYEGHQIKEYEIGDACSTHGDRWEMMKC